MRTLRLLSLVMCISGGATLLALALGLRFDGGGDERPVIASFDVEATPTPTLVPADTPVSAPTPTPTPRRRTTARWRA